MVMLRMMLAMRSVGLLKTMGVDLCYRARQRWVELWLTSCLWGLGCG
jgi:hypothetical protein